MKRMSQFLGLVLLALTGACAEQNGSLLAPGESRLGVSAAGGGQRVHVLQRERAPEERFTATARIGREGGRLELPGAGLQVIFPEGAVPLAAGESAVEITVTAVPGSQVAYTFEPHGLRFEKPVVLRQDAKHTRAARNPHALGAQGAYFPDVSYLDRNSNTAVVTEFRPTYFDAASAQFVWTIDHFSGYLVATNH